MSTTTEKELDLECSLCKDIYREPKTLGCLHSFCLECLETHYEKTHSNVNLKCPICRTPFQSESRDQLANLSTDTFLLNALNIHNTLANSFSQQNKQKLMCLDGENEATHYCLDCEEHFCEACTTLHKTMKMSKNHKLIPIEEMKNQSQVKIISKSSSQLYCQIHQQKEIDLFCENCKEPICSLCVPLHSSHKILTITDAIKNGKQSLIDLINQVSFFFLYFLFFFLKQINNSFLKKVKPNEKEKELRKGINECKEVVKQLEINSTSTQTQINELFNKIRNKLDEKEQELLDKLDEIEKYKKKGLELQIEELKFGIENIIGSCQMIKNSLTLSNINNHGNYGRLLSMKKLYESRLNYLSNTIWKIEPCHNPFIDFLISEKDEKSISLNISNIGMVDSNEIAADKCLIPRSQIIYKNEECKFEIISYSNEGNEMKKGGNKKKFGIQIEGEQKNEKNKKYEWNIVDLNNGRYEVKMKLKNEGKYSIFVKLNGLDIKSSPFHLKKCVPKIYYSSQGESMVHTFMKQNFSSCEYIEVNFNGKAINFQQPCFLFIFVVITDRFDDPSSWGKWIDKRMKETG